MPTIEPTVFSENPYDPAWFERDFLHSPDGVMEHPEHHCKQTFEVSLPYIGRFWHAVDIGCRDGEFSRYLQHHFAHVTCFDPRHRAFFPYNVDLRKVDHYLAALGDQEGVIDMFGGTHNPEAGKKLSVPCYTLDSFRLTGVDYIKIDVEGFELKVLKGAERTIERWRPVIVIEQNDATLAGEKPQAAKAWLEARGYQHAATCPRGWDHIMAPG